MPKHLPLRHGILRTMKIATIKDGSRDGQLAVVSRNLKYAHYASDIAHTLQAALDDWAFIAPQLQALSESLNAGRSKYPFEFDATQCMAPLPRAFQWADGSAYLNHFELIMQAKGETLAQSYYDDPCMYQGGSDDFLGANDEAVFGSEEFGIDFEAELAVITNHVPMNSSIEHAEEQIVLVGLLNDWSLRHLVPSELEKRFGFFQSKPATSFAPVFVTTDELGDAWQDSKLHLPVVVKWNGKKVGQANAGLDMVFNFSRLVQHASKTRNLGPGSIIGSGTVSNKSPQTGYSCIAEARAREMASDGKTVSNYMQAGDRIHIEVYTSEGQSIFGAIDQIVSISKKSLNT
jgi:fumarylacetoacetate (FAA) hydrolase